MNPLYGARNEGYVRRRRALLLFLLAVVYFVVARFVAGKAAHGFSHGDALPLVRNLFLLFLEIIGFGYMGLAFDKTGHPLRVMGLVRRSGWLREFAWGAAIGWGMMTAIALVLALSGALYVHYWGARQAFVLLAIQLGVLLAGSLAAEVVFRGYPFQKLIVAFGPFAATVLACIFFGLLRLETPAAGTAGIWVSGIVAVILSVAYLRTQALWLPWGLHFAWLASMGILFGLPIAGNTQAATVIQGAAYGPFWMTGGYYGPEAGWLTFIVLIVGLFVLIRLTRDLSWKYNQPDIQPAGIPVEVPHRPPASPVTKVDQQPQATPFVQIAPLPNATSSTASDAMSNAKPTSPLEPFSVSEPAPATTESQEGNLTNS